MDALPLGEFDVHSLSITGHVSNVWGLAWSPDGVTLESAS